MGTMSEGNIRKPGLFRMVGTMIRRRYYEEESREAQARLEVASLEAAEGALGEAVRAMRPEDEGLVPVLGGSPRKPGPEENATLRQQAQRAAFQEPLLKGYLRTLNRFVMGRGVTVTAEITKSGSKDRDEELEERVNAWLDDFREVNQWEKLEDEIPNRAWRDGESFIRRFTHEKDGPLVPVFTQRQRQRLTQLGIERDEWGGPSVPRGMTMLRMIDPDQIDDPLGIFEEGIVTSDIDAQHVVGYIWRPDKTKQDAEFIPADEMEHLKIGVDSDVLRGRTILEVLLKKNRQYEDWLQARILLSIARSSVYLFKKITGTRAQGQSLRDQEAKQLDSTNDQKVRMPKPGSSVHHGPGVEYEFKAPQLAAQDAQHDGRAILLNMAAGAGLPEYMFTADASNANFASTLVAEGPAFREFQSQQDDLQTTFRRLHWWAIEDAMQAGVIQGLTEERLSDITLVVQYPHVGVRDRKSEAEASEIENRARVRSRRTWAENSGLDYDTERERIMIEDQEDVEFTVPSAGAGAEED